MDNLKRDFTTVYVCNNCKATTPPPTHCGKAMELDDNLLFTCWKGQHAPCCGRESQIKYENCCENPKLEIQLSQMLS